MKHSEIVRILNMVKVSNQENSIILSISKSILSTFRNSLKSEFKHKVKKFRVVGSFASRTNLKDNREVDIDAIFEDDTHTNDQIVAELKRAIEQNGFECSIRPSKGEDLLRVKFEVGELPESYYMDIMVINQYQSLVHAESLSKSSRRKYYASKALWNVCAINRVEKNVHEAKNIIRVWKHFAPEGVKSIWIVCIVLNAANHVKKNAKVVDEALWDESVNTLRNLISGKVVLNQNIFDIKYEPYLILSKNDPLKLIEPGDPRINHLKNIPVPNETIAKWLKLVSEL